MVFEITKLTDKDVSFKENKLIPEHLMRVPFRCLMVAASQSGKSLVIGNILSKKEFGYKQAFKKNIFMFSPTYEMHDSSYHGVALEEDNVFKDFDEQVITEILEDQKKLIKRWGREKTPHCLLIFDDLIASMPQGKQSLFVKLAFSCRHYNVSWICAVQSYKHTPKAVRLNVSAMMIWKTNNKERTQIAEEKVIDVPVFQQIYEIATKPQFGFLYVNQTKSVRERYYSSFTERILLDEVEIEESDDEDSIDIYQDGGSSTS